MCHSLMVFGATDVPGYCITNDMQFVEVTMQHIFTSERTRSLTHQHDNTPVEDSSVVAVATGRTQERLLEDVATAWKHRVNSLIDGF